MNEGALPEAARDTDAKVSRTAAAMACVRYGHIAFLLKEGSPQGQCNFARIAAGNVTPTLRAPAQQLGVEILKSYRFGGMFASLITRPQRCCSFWMIALNSSGVLPLASMPCSRNLALTSSICRIVWISAFI